MADETLFSTLSTERVGGSAGATLVALTILLAALAGCDPGSSKASARKDATEAEPIPVETLTVHTRDFDQIFEVPAKAVADKEVTVSAEAAGRVLAAPFDEGDAIRAGARLIEVDTEMDSARIDLLENQLDSARREYERTEKLHEKGLATPQQLDQAETAVENARLNLEQAKVGLSKGGVRSPATGFVLRKMLDKGEFASPGAPIATITKYDPVIIRGQVPESLITRLKVGDPVEVFVPALDTVFETTVTRRAIEASSRTGTFGIEVRLDNAELEILPGMSARLRAVQKKWKDAPIVPREAILQGHSRAEAMVFPGTDEVGEAALRVVDLGPSRGPDVVVKSGLKQGARLIVRGHRGLVDGAHVRQVRHFDTLAHMRRAGASLELGGDEGDDGSDADDAATDQPSPQDAPEGTQ